MPVYPAARRDQTGTVPADMSLLTENFHGEAIAYVDWKKFGEWRKKGSEVGIGKLPTDAWQASCSEGRSGRPTSQQNIATDY